MSRSRRKAAELSKAAGVLRRAFDTMQARVNTLQTNAVTVKARVKEHYEAWSKQLTGHGERQLREKAQERLTESQKEFDKLSYRLPRPRNKSCPLSPQSKDIVIIWVRTCRMRPLSLVG